MHKPSFRFVLILITLTLSCAAGVRADQLYQVVGTITTTGTDYCNPAPCNLTINYSYTLDAVMPVDGEPYDQVLSSSVSGFGSIAGPFTMYNWTSLGYPLAYIPIESSAGEIDLFTSIPADYSNTSFAEWYSCLSATCFYGFLPPSEQAYYDDSGPADNVGYNGAYPFEMQQTVTEVSEGPMLQMLVAGVFCLAFLSRRIWSNS